ncbi:MAG: DUF3298 and DUF4163 domain-containing protein, partial [Spirochaetaceae bacterium]|nr:DUF3298 and DUF4163 domain-containing protein [Spirochaetaceae bacterium]
SGFACCVSLFLLLSCAGGKTRSGGSGLVRTFTYGTTLTGSGSPGIAFSFTLLDFDSSWPLKALAEEALYNGDDPETYADKTAGAFAAQFQGKASQREGEADEAGANWEYLEGFSVKDRNPEYLSIQRERYYYTGGAHGSGGIRHFVFDIREGKRLVLEDIIQEEKKDALTVLVNEALRAAHGLDPSSSLTQAGFFNDDAVLSGDFYLRGGMLIFQWDAYDIAPYAMGSVEAELPGKALRGLLTPEGGRLLAVR